MTDLVIADASDAVGALLPDLKKRLNGAPPEDDKELRDMLAGAIAEWVEFVGPWPSPLPANIRELVLNDTAGLYASTQRGIRARPDLTGLRTGAGAEVGVRPIVLYPRIRGYAEQRQKTRSSTPLFLMA